MTVYVDDAVRPFGRMLMCHMVADTSWELHLVASRIGVENRHVQYAGTPREHYDICKSKRELAIKAGAVPITTREIAKITLEKRRATK